MKTEQVVNISMRYIYATIQEAAQKARRQVVFMPDELCLSDKGIKSQRFTMP